MRHIKSYKIFESSSRNSFPTDPERSQIWSDIEDILTPVSDDGVLCTKIQNFSPTDILSLSSILIKKDWSVVKDRDMRHFGVSYIKDELNHLCSRFPDIIKKIHIFRSFGKGPTTYTPEEFIIESPVGNTFLVAITLKIRKDGAAENSGIDLS